MKKWMCTVCGYSVVAEEPPDVCPVCGADKSLFEAIEETPNEASPEQRHEDVADSSATEPDKADDFKSKAMKIGEGLIMAHHLHPISVHVPNGVVPVCFVFVLLSVVSGGVSSLDKAALFNLIFVLLSMPFVVLTGFVDWKNKYNSAMTKVFKTKMICAGVLTITSLIAVLWRAFDSSAGSSLIYLLLNAVILASAGIAGFMGGKLVFKK